MNNTPITPVRRQKKTSIVQWVKEHQRMLLVGAVVVLKVQNNALKQRNAEQAERLMEAGGALKEASAKLEAYSMFDRIFGQQNRQS